MFLPPPPLPRGSLKGVGGNQPPLVGLPLNLRAMFDPITPLEFKPPLERKPTVPISGISTYVKNFETTPPPPPKPFIPPTEAKALARERLQKLHQEKNELLAQDWDPHNNHKATSNAFATVFVSRLSYDTNEKKLRREFELYGPIRSIRVVTDAEGKSRGYAFVEYDNEKDAETAVRKSEGKRIDGRKILCDVERGRTVKNWRPMRLGGGMGGGRVAQKSKKQLEEEQMRAATVSSSSAAIAAIASGAGGSAGHSGEERGHRGGRSRSRSPHHVSSRRHTHNSRSRSRGRDTNTRGARHHSRDRDRDRDRDTGSNNNRNGHYGPSGGGGGSGLGSGLGSGGGGGGYSNGNSSRRTDHSRDRERDRERDSRGGGYNPRGRSRDRR